MEVLPEQVNKEARAELDVLLVEYCNPCVVLFSDLVCEWGLPELLVEGSPEQGNKEAGAELDLLLVEYCNLCFVLLSDLVRGGGLLLPCVDGSFYLLLLCPWPW